MVLSKREGAGEKQEGTGKNEKVERPLVLGELEHCSGKHTKDVPSTLPTLHCRQLTASVAAKDLGDQPIILSVYSPSPSPLPPPSLFLSQILLINSLFCFPSDFFFFRIQLLFLKGKKNYINIVV